MINNLLTKVGFESWTAYLWNNIETFILSVKIDNTLNFRTFKISENFPDQIA
jgi:hypothetical protein